MSFGLDPFGTDPLGSVFDATSASADTIAATAAACRVLGVNGDYERADDGVNLRDAADPIGEEVYFRLATALGSYSADVTLGNSVATIRVASSSSTVAIRDAVLRALEPMRARGVISTITVDVATNTQQGTTRGEYRVSYQKTGVRR
jgi:hypothetical protein